MKKARWLVSIGIWTVSIGLAQAIDIPLSGGTGGDRGGKIGYVDMDRIFQIYPQTQFAREDYAKQLKKKREQLAEKEEELAAVKNRLAILESTLKDIGASASTATAIDGSTQNAAGLPPDSNSAASVQGASQSQTVMAMKKELEERQVEFEEMRKRAYDELAAFENQQSQLILGKIYMALKDLAAEEQITLVVDKSSILYGAADVDLTEKLQQKVRGY